MNIVVIVSTLQAAVELVVDGAETPFRHAGSQVSLWHIFLEYKGKPFAPNSWVRTFFCLYYHPSNIINLPIINFVVAQR